LDSPRAGEEPWRGFAVVTERAEPALQSMRQELKLNADGQVRMCFEGHQRVPVFECFPCEALMLWREEQGWWQCPECSYELTPAEAEELLHLALLRLELRVMDVRRKQGKGRWQEFLRRLARAFASWSS
jgi:hypothetical protein